MTWRDDLSESAYDFLNTVSPVVEDWVEGELVSVEGTSTSDVAEKLDQIAGVDYWNFDTDAGVRPVGSRVQYAKNGTNPDGEPYDTFTIRNARESGVPTEFDKRLEAIHNDTLYPYWTVQAYLTRHRGDLMSVAITKTKPLIKHIDSSDIELEGGIWERTADDPETGQWARFYCVSWNYLRFETTIGVQIEHDEKVIERYKNRLNGQTTLADGGRSCDECGFPLNPSQRFCPRCNTDQGGDFV